MYSGPLLQARTPTTITSPAAGCSGGAMVRSPLLPKGRLYTRRLCNFLCLIFFNTFPIAINHGETGYYARKDRCGFFFHIQQVWIYSFATDDWSSGFGRTNYYCSNYCYVCIINASAARRWRANLSIIVRVSGDSCHANSIVWSQ